MSAPERTASGTSPWTAGYRARPQARIRLFCIPYAGGTANIFNNWPASMPVFVDVCPIQMPGRGARIHEPAYTQIAPLVTSLAASLDGLLDRPFALFGHSMGALVSFELARTLRRQGKSGPSQIFVSGSSAPQIPDPNPPVFALPEPEFIAELRRLNGTPAEVLEHPELMQLVLPLLRADFEACQTYEYSPEAPLACPITAFGGLQDPDMTREDIDAWRTQTTGRFTLRMLPGDHFFIQAHEAVVIGAVARELLQLTEPGRRS